MSVEIKITNPAAMPLAELHLAIRILSTIAADRVAGVEYSTACIPLQEGATHVSADFEADVLAAEAAAVPETEAQRLYRLHGNMASAGGDYAEKPAQVFGGHAPKPADVAAPVAPSPLAPVAPTAPENTAAAAPNPNSAIATDKAGLPWDQRIHSEGKTVNKGDGLWKAKRNVDPALKANVEAELLQLMAIPANPSAPKPPTDGPSTPVAPTAPTPTAPSAPDPAAAPTAPPAPLATAQVSTIPKNLGELMIKAQAAVAAGRMAMLELTEAVKAEGIAALPLLGTRPDLIPAVYARLAEKLQ